ncbi:hypothetical protein [Flavihumibacter sp. CACIAM 22H1]|uniref:HD domain-containing protein n=1 Tax=Flavihumibacter sp. CACIAM 22H1 TaxID=1812911 RepID=UPI0007A7C853|nr:hypothetical protein [Flavihumibacter sp. CACIAM 22H1]KYP14705.1 MAG: hypothetical protein A1D16_14805 [Flavihumibacter sp. CACIAM 22H1]
MERSIKNAFLEQMKGWANESEIERMWKEIEKAYAAKNRFYHTISHLDQLLTELKICLDLVPYWQEIVAAIAYHDIIYSIRRQDNEEKSALLAVARLQAISWPPEKIELVRQLILATKGHHAAGFDLINYFTDADLAILGKPAALYQQYAGNIRKEYRIFPDFLYRKGRKKLLQHFLEVPRIYKTAQFYQLYESQARTNLTWEIAYLDGVAERP